MGVRLTTFTFMGQMIWPTGDIFANLIVLHNETVQKTCGGETCGGNKPTAGGRPPSQVCNSREASMRLMAVATLVGAVLATMTAPATAVWRGYISHPLGFAFAAPGEIKVEKGIYRGDVAGPHDTLVYRFVDDNIEYKVVVIDMRDKANDAATLLGEAEYMFQDGKKVLMDTFGRVDRQFGRKLTVDLPDNAGRTSAAFYFVDGRIVSLQATVLPANGDYDTPEMGRFVDSITFFTVLAPDDAIELPAPPK
jgi:hypothetical protein